MCLIAGNTIVLNNQGLVANIIESVDFVST